MAATLYNPPVREEMIRLEGKPTGSTKVRGLEHILFVCRQRLQGVPRTLAEVNYSLQILSVLRALGWQKSIRSGEPVDVQGMEIPWYSYAALEWLTPRVKPTDVVFEYGAGNSTAWFARHAKRVVSVEHNPTWLTRVHAKVGENVTLLSRHTSQGEESGDAGSSYVAALEEFAPESFDIIAIDGPERVSCARVAPTRRAAATPQLWVAWPRC